MGRKDDDFRVVNLWQCLGRIEKTDYGIFDGNDEQARAGGEEGC